MLEETERRGEMIQGALAKQEQFLGTYPDQLEALVPRFLPSIPLPTVGARRWEYRVYENGHYYRLRVATSNDSEPLLQTDSNPGGWSYDTK